MPKNNASVHVNYQVKTGVGKPDDKIKMTVNRNKSGIHAILTAGIAECDDSDLDTLAQILSGAGMEVHDADSTPENHVKVFRGLAKALNQFADILEG